MVLPTRTGRLSLGGAISSHEVSTSTLLHNLFDEVDGDESNAGDTNYRIAYLRNGHGTLAARNTRVYMDSAVPAQQSSANNYNNFVYIGVGAAVNTQVTAIADEDTAPTGVTFSNPGNLAGALDLGDIPAGEYRAIAFRRTISAGAAARDNANVELTIVIDTQE